MIKYGVSFSIKCARGFDLDWQAVFLALLNELGVRRMRLMSYWDEIETVRGQYDFEDLDWQFEQLNNCKGKVTLAIGLRQPRYPECHQPEWADRLETVEWNQALSQFLTAVIERYKECGALVSWQLENEALNRGIGECRDYDKKRLVTELDLVKRLDPNHPVVMSLSNSFGLPIRRPRPDIYAISLYFTQYNHESGYSSSRVPSWLIRFRCQLIKFIWWRPVFIHELQVEPWGPVGNADLPLEEASKSMNVKKLFEAVYCADKLKLGPIDMWGAEWWYWRKMAGDDSLWKAARQIFKDSR